jgi:hypothetical protein
MRRNALAALGGLFLLLETGCATIESLDWTGYEARFTEDQKLYTQLMRWEEWARASEHVPPDQRSDFMAAMRALGPIHVTDYEVGTPEYDAESQTASVHVRYFAYHKNTLQSVALSEDQHWKRNLETGKWQVDHDGPPLVAIDDVSAR